MINFHKFGFLDCKRLINYLNESYSYLCEYSPVWLFVNSDYYKPEISFTNEWCFIRYRIPELGLVYFPPLGNGDHLDMVLLDLEEDSKEAGYEFLLGPVLEKDLIKYKPLGIKLYENEKLNTYIYMSENLSLLSSKIKKFKKPTKYFEIMHKDAYIKKIKKEDFPRLIEFLSKYRESANIDNSDLSFYPKLNILKKCMEHLYELDINGVVIEDSEKIYGFALGSIMDNTCHMYLSFGLEDEIGAYPEVIMGFSKYMAPKAKYIAFYGYNNDNKLKERLEELKPLRVEKHFGTFNI